MCAVDQQFRQRRYRLPTGRSALRIPPFLANFHLVQKMIKPERLVINPELVAIIGVEAAHMLESLKGPLDVKGNADFLGPFTRDCLIERFAILDAAAGKFWHVGRAGLG